MHAGRRRRAEQTLRSLRPERLLFVCLGNVCRSPFAERVLLERHPGRFEAESAGFIGPGRAPPAEALTAARSLGVEHSDHRSRVVSAEALSAADLVIVFDRSHARRLSRSHGRRAGVLWLGDVDPVWSGRRAIVDPWGGPQSGFDEGFARIARCIDALVETLDAEQDVKPKAGDRG